LLDRKPDWVVSGINHGSNASVSVIYSGTMAAAIEGCLYGVDSVGFSLNDFSSKADFEPSRKYIRDIMNSMAQKPLPKGVCLNVNFPLCPKDKIKGIKVCRQANGSWIEEFDKRKDPMGKTYYWLTGVFTNHEPEAIDTDEWALANNFVSVVPVKLDMTAHEYLEVTKTRFENV
jgi:5'-nucleotidase